MKLKTIVTFLYLLISAPLFLFFYTEAIVWISFFINYLFLTLLAYYHLNLEKNYSPFLSSYIVFNFLFFLVAPIIQISSIETNSLSFPNGYPYNSWDTIYSNFLILFCNIFFILSYIFFKKKYINPIENVKSIESNYSTPVVIFVLFIGCLLIGIFNYNFLIDEYIRASWTQPDRSIGSLLIRKKVLFLIPLGAIVITYKYLKEKKIVTNNTIISLFILASLILLLLIFKNPLTEKRNALGPIYITLIYLFYPKLINSNSKTFLFLFLSMILIFPLMSAFTHLNIPFDEIILKPQLFLNSIIESGSIIKVFGSLHYDAFANIMATVDYVSQNGYSFGYQLLSALFFFIPRSIWISKPLSTGQVVGNHLIDEHGFLFNNLSNPIVSEGYINFGFAGIILMAILLSFFIVKFMNWLNSGDSLNEIIAFYFAIHLMFLLRGDFTNGFVYFIGTMIGVLWIPKMIIKSLKYGQSEK